MKIKRQLTAVIVAGAMGVGIGASPAMAAAPTSVTHVAASTVTVSSIASAQGVVAGQSAGISVSAVGAGAAGAAVGDLRGNQATPQAWWIRYAVKAAMATIKATSRTLYNQIISAVARGKTAFVNFWNTQVPAWAKGLLGGISGNAIYDALKWLIGL